MPLKKHLIILSVLLSILIGLTIMTLYVYTLKYQDFNVVKLQDLEKEKSIEELLIGFSIGTYQEERWLIDREIFISKTHELGAGVTIKSANGSVERQIEQCKELISQKVDVLVIIAEDSDRLRKVVDEAVKKGIPVIAYDRLIKNAKLAAFITYDNVAIGELQAQFLTEKSPKGTYMLLGGDEKDYNSLQIKKGQMAILNPYIEKGDIIIVEDKWIKNWNPSGAKDIIKRYDGKLTAVLAANDGIAGGVIQTLSEEKKMGKVLISGQDADLAACQRIVEGIQAMTVYTPIKREADACVEIAIKIANNESFKYDYTIENGKYEVPVLSLEPIIVHKENMVDTVIKDGFHQKAEVYKNIPMEEWP